MCLLFHKLWLKTQSSDTNINYIHVENLCAINEKNHLFDAIETSYAYYENERFRYTNVTS